MTNLTHEQIEEYFRRSFKAIDGLWYMKIEERFGFETALELDAAVWRVLPKIQARIMKGMMTLDKRLDELQSAIGAKLSIEGYEFRIENNENSFKIIVSNCPWHAIMVKSGREKLSENVSNLICRLENSVWASEFGMIEFELDEQICKGADKCIMRFIMKQYPSPGIIL